MDIIQLSQMLYVFSYLKLILCDKDFRHIIHKINVFVLL